VKIPEGFEDRLLRHGHPGSEGVEEDPVEPPAAVAAVHHQADRLEEDFPEAPHVTLEAEARRQEGEVGFQKGRHVDVEEGPVEVEQEGGVARRRNLTGLHQGSLKRIILEQKTSVG